MKAFQFSILFLIITGGLFVSLPSDAQKEKALFYTQIQKSPLHLNLVEVDVVDKVLKSDLIQLKNRKLYVLDNIRVPAFVMKETMDYLEQRIKGKKVGIFVNPDLENHWDEHGNTLVHLQMEDGTWVQEEMVAKGLAWAYSSLSSRDLILPLYKKEIAARRQKLGLWSHPQMAVRNEYNIHADINSFQVFDGKIVGVKQKPYTTAFYFGEDPKTDFTLYLDEKYDPLFRISYSKRNYSFFEGVRVRVRGWVYERNGPAMDVTHPEQIEFSDFDNMSRQEALRSSSPPPLMPYDVDEVTEKEKKK